MTKNLNQLKKILKDKQKYNIVFDAGKPYDMNVQGEKNLKKELKRFYQQNKDNDYGFDVKVFSKGKDISETQFVNEIIEDIIE